MKQMIENEMHCKDCQITFDYYTESDYVSTNRPCCPRCGSENIEMFRLKGNIVKA